LRHLAQRLTLLLGLALAAGLLSTAAPAMASTISATCAMEGTAHTDPPIPIQGGNGTYSFDDFGFACEGTVNGKTDVITSSVTTSGTYRNNVCLLPHGMTGTLDSTEASATVATTTAGNAGVSFSFPYHIDFTAGVGQLTFVSPASGRGEVDMVPTGPQAVPGCTSTFSIVGELDLNV
jgi:hypothetical protein